MIQLTTSHFGFSVIVTPTRLEGSETLLGSDDTTSALQNHFRLCLKSHFSSFPIQGHFKNTENHNEHQTKSDKVYQQPSRCQSQAREVLKIS